MPILNDPIFRQSVATPSIPNNVVFPITKTIPSIFYPIAKRYGIELTDGISKDKYSLFQKVRDDTLLHWLCGECFDLKQRIGESIESCFIWRAALYHDNTFPFYFEDLLLCYIWDIKRKVLSRNQKIFGRSKLSDIWNNYAGDSKISFTQLIDILTKQYGINEIEYHPLHPPVSLVFNYQFALPVFQHRLKDIYIQMVGNNDFIQSQRDYLRRKIAVIIAYVFDKRSVMNTCNAISMHKDFRSSPLSVNIFKQSCRNYSNYGAFGLFKNNKRYKSSALHTLDLRFRVYIDIASGIDHAEVFQRYNFRGDKLDSHPFNRYRSILYSFYPLLPDGLRKALTKLKPEKKSVKLLNDDLVRFEKLLDEAETLQDSDNIVPLEMFKELQNKHNLLISGLSNFTSVKAFHFGDLQSRYKRIVELISPEHKSE